MPHVYYHKSGVADATRRVGGKEHDQVGTANDRIILTRGKGCSRAIRMIMR